MLSTATRWFLYQDRYYWITSSLAARGRQRVTCRLVAANMLGLNVISLILMLGDVGPMERRNCWPAVLVSLCFFGMGALWMRPRWPTRVQSQLCVVVGSVCIAGTCLIAPDPGLGLMGAFTFLMVSSFTALFHDGRLVAYTWCVAAATLAALAVRIGSAEPAVTVCGIVMFVLINSFVVFLCRNVVGLVKTTAHYGELESLTGLLTREAFIDRVATMIAARDRHDDRYLALVLVSLDSFSLLTATRGAAGGNEARVAVGHRLGQTLRRDALLSHYGESEYLVADTFSRPDATVLTDRLQHCVRTTPFRLTASIGVVAMQIAPLVGHPPHDVIEELVTIATSNMNVARSDGGQCTEVTANPRLTSIEHIDSADGDDSPAM